MGSIPACTGEPTVCAMGTIKAAVYPRVYGGTSVAMRSGLKIAGLSPRVRGNPL